MTPIPPDQADQLRQLIQDCGNIALELSRQPFKIAEKGPEDYVTAVDQQLDLKLTAALRDLFPQDGIITEENQDSWKSFTRLHDRLWLVDPLDGTEDFIHGRSGYAVMVGLLTGDLPIAGWVFAPVKQQLFWGGPAWGLFHQIESGPVQSLIPQPPALPSLNDCSILLGDRDQRNYGSAICQHLPGIQFHTMGSFGLKVLSVIQGQFGLYAYFNRRVKLWDTVGPLALAQAAGLVCCDLAGQPIGYTSNFIDPQTLAHQQPMLIGWPDYVEALRPSLQRAITAF